MAKSDESEKALQQSFLEWREKVKLEAESIPVQGAGANAYAAGFEAAVAWKQAEDLAAVEAVLAVDDCGGDTPDFGQGWDAACHAIERRIKGEE